jgi:GNAT superfamily N-acetyltransferase
MIIIRTAEEKDFESFKTLNNEIQDIHYQVDSAIFKPVSEIIFSLDDYKIIIEKDKNKVFVACLNDVVVGYAFIENMHVNEDRLKYARNFILIHHLVVSKNSRNLGIGKLLIEAVRNFSKKINVPRIEIDVWNENSDAKVAYERFGFIPFRERLSIKV